MLPSGAAPVKRRILVLSSGTMSEPLLLHRRRPRPRSRQHRGLDRRRPAGRAAARLPRRPRLGGGGGGDLRGNRRAASPSRRPRIPAAARARRISARSALRELLREAFGAAAPRQAEAVRELDALRGRRARSPSPGRRGARHPPSPLDLGRDGGAAESPLWPVLRSAGALLASEEADRIRTCAGPDCGWMYVDRSRNGFRRWCQMRTCGTREKSRRRRVGAAG